MLKYAAAIRSHPSNAADEPTFCCTLSCRDGDHATKAALWLSDYQRVLELEDHWARADPPDRAE